MRSRVKNCPRVSLICLSESVSMVRRGQILAGCDIERLNNGHVSSGGGGGLGRIHCFFY